MVRYQVHPDRVEENIALVRRCTPSWQPCTAGFRYTTYRATTA